MAKKNSNHYSVFASRLSPILVPLRQVKDVIKVLKAAKSSYAPAFAKLRDEVEARRDEANSNNQSLAVLDRLLQQVAQF